MTRSRRRAIAQSVADAAVLCRVIRHRWTVIIPNTRDKVPRGFDDLALQCDTCTTKRFDRIDKNTGEVTHKYDYPEGYSYSRDDFPSGERPTTNDLRLSLRKVLKRYDADREMEMLF